MQSNFENIITEQQCLIILRQKLKTTNFKLINYQVCPISETRKGFTGEHFYLNCRVQLDDENCTVKFFIKQKCIDCNALLTNDREQMTKIYDKEATFYKIISTDDNIDQHGVWIPKFYGYFDRKLLIFDNLMEKGFKSYEQLKFDLKHCKQVMCALAKLHAFSLQWTKKQENVVHTFECFTEILFTESALHEQTFFNANVQTLHYLIELLTNSKLSHSELKERLDRRIEKILEDVQPSKKFPNVITHGDLWRNNILFQYDGETDDVINCCLVDFQLVKFTSPVYDILFFLYQNTTLEFQQEYFHQLIDYYYEQLLANVSKYNLDLNEIFSKGDFRLAIQEYNASLKLMAFMYSAIGCIRKEDLVKMLATPEDRINLLVNKRLSYLKQAVANDSECKDKLLRLSKQIEEILVDDRIFRENCYEILEKKFKTRNYKLNKFALEPLPCRVGYLGEHQILNINVKRDDITNENYTFFLKFLPREQGQCDTLLKWQGFEREIFYYYDIFDKMKQLNINIIRDVVPEMYLAIKNFVIVFDDLTKKNYQMCDKYKQLDLTHVQCFLKTLAKFHAATVIFEERMSQNGVKFNICDMAPNIFVENVYKKDGIINGAINGIEYIKNTYFPDFHIENFPEKLEKLKLKFISLTERSRKYRNVLCHGDLWSNNVLFQNNDQDMPIHSRIVDFQLGRYLPQAHDVIGSVYLMTNMDLFDKYHRSLLEQYYWDFKRILEKYGIDCERIISFNDFLASCEEMKIFGLLQKAFFYQFIMMSPDIEERFLVDFEKNQRIINGDRSEMIDENWQKSIVYRELMYDSHISIFELCQNLTL